MAKERKSLFFCDSAVEMKGGCNPCVTCVAADLPSLNSLLCEENYDHLQCTSPTLLIVAVIKEEQYALTTFPL